MDGFINFAFVFALGFMDEKGGVLILRHFFAVFFGFFTGIKEFDNLVAALNENLPLVVFVSLGDMINFSCNVFSSLKYGTILNRKKKFAKGFYRVGLNQ